MKMLILILMVVFVMTYDISFLIFKEPLALALVAQKMLMSLCRFTEDTDIQEMCKENSK